MTAETGALDDGSPAARQASMEPRSFDRGDNEVQYHMYAMELRLQWSRGLLTAETLRCGRAAPTIVGFNGAAVF